MARQKSLGSKEGGLPDAPLKSPIGILSDQPYAPPRTDPAARITKLKKRAPSPIADRRLARLNEAELIPIITRTEPWEGTFGRGLRRQESMLFVDHFMTASGHDVIEWRRDYQLKSDQARHPAFGDDDDCLDDHAIGSLAALKLPRPGCPGYFWEEEHGRLQWSTDIKDVPDHVDRNDLFEGFFGDRVDDEIAEKFLEDQLELVRQEAQVAPDQQATEAQRKRKARQVEENRKAGVRQAYEAVYASEWLKKLTLPAGNERRSFSHCPLLPA